MCPHFSHMSDPVFAISHDLIPRVPILSCHTLSHFFSYSVSSYPVSSYSAVLPSINVPTKACSHQSLASLQTRHNFVWERDTRELCGAFLERLPENVHDISKVFSMLLGERLQEALEKPSEVPSAQPVKLDMARQGSGAWSTARRASSTLASDASDDDNAPLSTPRDTCTQLAIGANRRPGGNRSPRYLERRKERGCIGIGQRAPGWSEAAALTVHEHVVHLSKYREDKCITKQLGLILSSEIEVDHRPP